MEDLGKDFPQILPLSIKIQKHTFTKSSLMVKIEIFVEKFPNILPSYLHCLVKKGNLNLLVQTLFKNNPLKTRNKLG